MPSSSVPSWMASEIKPSSLAVRRLGGGRAEEVRCGVLCTLQTRIYFQFVSLDSGVSRAGRQQEKNGEAPSI